MLIPAWVVSLGWVVVVLPIDVPRRTARVLDATRQRQRTRRCSRRTRRCLSCPSRVTIRDDSIGQPTPRSTIINRWRRRLNPYPRQADISHRGISRHRPRRAILAPRHRLWHNPRAWGRGRQREERGCRQRCRGHKLCALIIRRHSSSGADETWPTKLETTGHREREPPKGPATLRAYTSNSRIGARLRSRQKRLRKGIGETSTHPAPSY